MNPLLKKYDTQRKISCRIFGDDKHMTHISRALSSRGVQPVSNIQENKVGKRTNLYDPRDVSFLSSKEAVFNALKDRKLVLKRFGPNYGKFYESDNFARKKTTLGKEKEKQISLMIDVIKGFSDQLEKSPIILATVGDIKSLLFQVNNYLKLGKANITILDHNPATVRDLKEDYRKSNHNSLVNLIHADMFDQIQYLSDLRKCISLADCDFESKFLTILKQIEDRFLPFLRAKKSLAPHFLNLVFCNRDKLENKDPLLSNLGQVCKILESDDCLGPWYKIIHSVSYKAGSHDRAGESNENLGMQMGQVLLKRK